MPKPIAHSQACSQASEPIGSGQIISFIIINFLEEEIAINLL